jgi:hypothetical protein
MTGEHRPILEYASAAPAKPRRIWLPIVCLSVSSAVWYWPRLTPTGFPNANDLTVLGLLAPACFAIARFTSLPSWVLTLFGGLGVGLFLFANFNDNNFRRNAVVRDMLLPWSAMVLGGALGARLIAGASRTARLRRVTGPS